MKKELIQQLTEDILKLVKEKMEKLMEAERELYTEEYGVRKNGFYERGLLTRWGKIEDLRIPRTREGDFYPSLLTPYSRSWHLEDILLGLYAGGMSYEEIRKVLNTLLEATLSPTSISRLTEIAYEDAQAWRNRPLRRKYVVIWLDACFVNLRRDTVKKEALYVALGLDEEGKKEILGFWIHPSESSTLWEEILRELKERGVEEVEMFVTDGLRGIKEAIVRVFPQLQVATMLEPHIKGLAGKGQEGGELRAGPGPKEGL